MFIYLVIGLTIGECLIFYGSSRFRAPIEPMLVILLAGGDRKSTRLNSSHSQISYAVFCLKKKKHSDHLPTHAVDRCLPSACRLLAFDRPHYADSRVINVLIGYALLHKPPSLDSDARYHAP